METFLLADLLAWKTKKNETPSSLLLFSMLMLPQFGAPRRAPNGAGYSQRAPGYIQIHRCTILLLLYFNITLLYRRGSKGTTKGKIVFLLNTCWIRLKTHLLGEGITIWFNFCISRNLISFVSSKLSSM